MDLVRAAISLYPETVAAGNARSEIAGDQGGELVERAGVTPVLHSVLRLCLVKQPDALDGANLGGLRAGAYQVGNRYGGDDGEHGDQADADHGCDQNDDDARNPRARLTGWWRGQKSSAVLAEAGAFPNLFPAGGAEHGSVMMAAVGVMVFVRTARVWCVCINEIAALGDGQVAREP